MTPGRALNLKIVAELARRTIIDRYPLNKFF